jgi:undecaprenyl diphosphate synthase
MTERELLASLDPTRLPRHIAAIMDGNGRWARQRGLPRIEGHRASMQSIRETVNGCSDLGIGFLTLYAFSTENWSRPNDEVAALLVLIDHAIRSQIPELHENRVRMKHLGRRDGLPQALLDTLDDSERITAGNSGLVLQLAVNYGGRQELVDAARLLVGDVLAGEVSPEAVTEEEVAKRLYRPETPDPDLLIRTGGEMRLSNYMLWEIAYAEIWVTPTLWPDFRKPDLYQAIAEFQSRQRRFGGVENVAQLPD